MSKTTEKTTTHPSLPLAVQVGFSGSRNLLSADSTLTPEQRETFHQAIQQTLTRHLADLPQTLRLQPHHFLCGIAQIAIGADMLFTRSCAARAIPQQIFLPQTRDEFLSATSSSGTPDFTPEEKAGALTLLASPHIVSVRVASDAHNRTDRFEETNQEILQASDVCICLFRSDAGEKSGGARSFLADAHLHQKPILEIQVHEKGGLPVFQETWHPSKHWQPPTFPEELAGIALPPQLTSPSPGVPIHSSEFLGAIKSAGSQVAQWQQTVFKFIALIVIAAHLLATVCAVGALAAGHESEWVPKLLGIELLFLAAGFFVHRHLHHSHTVGLWASSRLSAEIARSVSAMHDMPVRLDYLFSLPLPETFRSLLETINLLHLASHKQTTLTFEDKRKNYLKKRFNDPKSGQPAYYAGKLASAVYWKKFADLTFTSATVAAFVFTATKLALHLWEHHHPEAFPHQLAFLPLILGSFAILLPVIAVGALSLAASFDLEARAHTYSDTLQYLQETLPLLHGARTEGVFIHRVLQTESRLLGETANWFSRRSFTSVA